MKYYIVDAFTDKNFSGNPAGICMLDEEISSKLMQDIATENNLSETAFCIKDKDLYKLRWFTPESEIDLCGHATLATAYIIMKYIEDVDEVEFLTKSGTITVSKVSDKLQMKFPVRKPQKIEITQDFIKLLDIEPVEIYSSRDLIVVLQNEQEVLEYKPDYRKLRKLSDWLGIVITARGDNVDYVSRYFCPELDDEDPVTGSSQCSLVPYWSERLSKNELYTMQLSKRRGSMKCIMSDDCVLISGSAKLYLEGNLNIDKYYL